MNRRKKTGRFSKAKVDVTDNLKPAYQHNVSVEHSYFNIDTISHEEVVSDVNLEDWRSGRRVVELDVLAEGLSHCINSKCLQPLSLGQCLSIQTFGLASVLQVRCSICHTTNAVKTGRKHDRTFDVNTKLAVGMVHAGVGVSQLNNLLSSINIPPVHHTLVSRRLKETGEVIEKVASATVDEALEEEADADGEIEASVDAGWQKRGCGKSYDSLSGHATMIGTRTGKVVGYAVRSKSCRVCNAIRETGQSSKGKHSCRKNWVGSAKAMEPDMVVEMVNVVKEKGIITKAIVGDEDASTIAYLKAKVDSSILKKSDKNHIRKTVSNHLYSMQKEHRSLSNKIIKSLMKSFSYMIAQNKGNPEGIIQGLDALICHHFGDHKFCGQWCGKKENAHAKYSSLPYGKPLSDGKLRHALELFFGRYKAHAEKLSNLGSTQTNESLNKTIASKAPKHLHFSGSAHLNYRVAASIAQKNIGHSYLLNVNRRMGLSPGAYTIKLAKLRDYQARKRKAIANSHRAKLRRVVLKQQRSQRKQVTELREGDTYKSDINLSVQHDTDTIPNPIFKLVPEKIPTDDVNYIFFDLETTGLGRKSHITQIAALRGEESFSAYIMPKKPITAKAMEITGLSIKGTQMYNNDIPVPSKSLKQALEEFCTFLGQTHNNVLVGHNVMIFDCPVLFNALYAVDKVEAFSDRCIGFIDTLKLFKLSQPNLKSYKQVELVQHFLNETYNAHNASEDVNLLQRLFNKCNVDKVFLDKASFLLSYSIKLHKYMENVTLNMPSLTNLVQKKIVSEATAKKIAGSGLLLVHITLAYKRQGVAGVEALFSETCNNQVRVTRSKNIINKVNDYLKSLDMDK